MASEEGSVDNHELAAPPGPVPGSERITSVDTLRGVAVLGILVMNIYAFAMPAAAYGNPLLMGGTEWYNLATWYVTHIVFDQKFMTIFSMLFGGGLVIMWQRTRSKDTEFGRIYFRRQLWLLLIGIAHAYLIWFGDILFLYAIIGMIAYFFRRIEPRNLIILGIMLLTVGPVLSLSGGAYLEQLERQSAEIAADLDAGEAITSRDRATRDKWASFATFLSPSTDNLQDEVRVHRGDYAGIVKHHAPRLLELHLSAPYNPAFWRIAGLMLIGMALMKAGILAGKPDARLYRMMALCGYGLGLPVTIASSAIATTARWDGVFLYGVGSLPNYVGSILVALGHIATVMLIVKAGIAARLVARFAAVGRMALTNYLMHSVVMTTLFYGYGLGLYGHIPRAAQMLFVAGMLGFQLWLSPIWLDKFRFGPAEWLWRSLTYWTRQPMWRRG